MTAPTLIEFTHRMMTTLDTFAIIGLCVWAFLAFPKRHAVRWCAIFSLVFLFIEALLGAGLVIFRHVAHDESAGRAWYLSGHLVNTMLMLAALAATAWLAHTNTREIRIKRIPRALWGALAITAGVSVTGAIAALGDTLFPAASLAEGMQRDFSSASSMLLRLRLVHPVVAILGAAYLIWTAARMVRGKSEEGSLRAAGVRVIALVVLQLVLGAMNLSLLAPIGMQLIHLLVADIVWLSVVILVLSATAGSGVLMPERASAAPMRMNGASIE